MCGESPVDFAWDSIHQFELSADGKLLDSYRSSQNLKIPFTSLGLTEKLKASNPELGKKRLWRHPCLESPQGCRTSMLTCYQSFSGSFLEGSPFTPRLSGRRTHFEPWRSGVGADSITAFFGGLFPDGGGVEPVDGGVVGEELQQVFEEAPDRLVLYQVMRQDAGRFVDITITGAPRLQVLNQNCDGGIDTDKTSLVTPVYRVEMRVYLE